MREKNASPFSNPGETSLSVIARRRYHVGITKWEARWLPWLQATGAILGLAVVLMPSISKGWLAAIERVSLFRFIYEQFSSLGWLVATTLILYAITHAITAFMWKHSYPGWDARKEWGLPNAKQILDRDLFPSTRKQEFVFLVYAFQAFLSPFLVMILFGVVAYFIRFVRS